MEHYEGPDPKNDMPILCSLLHPIICSRYRSNILKAMHDFSEKQQE